LFDNVLKTLKILIESFPHLRTVYILLVTTSFNIVSILLYTVGHQLWETQKGWQYCLYYKPPDTF